MPVTSLVFISYSRRDYYFAESLAFHLLRNGVQAWMDVKDLEPGNDWERDLEGALDSASTVLLVWSKEAFASERVRDEWQRALKRGSRTIVLVVRNAPLPVELQTSDIAATFGRHWQVGLLCLAAPLSGLGILVLLRPEDLLRWTPTGKAWPRYRVGHVANAAFARAELASRFEQVKTFTLAYDPVDAPMAARLREQLTALGGSHAPNSGAPSVAVLLLTNRTGLAWIDAEAQRLRGAELTVIGTGIGLPAALDWLWRRQWIDFRRWDIRRTERGLALPQVPDAVTQTRLPAVVTRAHHVLCAVAALLFIVAGGIFPESASQPDALAADEVLAYLAFGVALAWGLIAHQLVKRNWTATQLIRYGVPGAVGAGLVIAAGIFLADRLAFRLIASLVLLVAASAWLSRQRSSLAFWLPQEGSTRAAKRSALGTYRDWSTLIWCLVYVMLWRWLWDLA